MQSIFTMPTNEAIRILPEIGEAMVNVFADQKVHDAMLCMHEKLGKKASGLKAAILGSALLVPAMLNKEHGEDTYKLLAACKGVDVDTVKRQSLLKTVNDIMSMLTLATEAPQENQ
ncbi:MAG: hypothetical protein IKK75_13710 [Clostridia bacterium]|nr:hypothetical protein [Clostridia bacterium]